ncbi:MAG: glutamate--tRNA ligase [Actinomycetota bacterium]|nr:glutamate--tRNA ligase [Actinomycetota bacterium]
MTGAGVRVRFAPSPTGFFHVGSARTALFNWLFARQQGGAFLLRIEDTDAERNRPEWIDMIFTSMRWLGLDWDDEPVYQSHRSELYAKAAQRLFADGNAYYCTCTRDDVGARTKDKATPGYDGFCRDRGLGPDSGGALRFRTPESGSTTVVDLVRGQPVFEHATIEDFVVMRSNGTPIFILANVVDDVDMAISHVVRGEDHLPNTPKYLLLWEALGGGEAPAFAHLPLLVNAQRQKLSKRRDKVALEDYREQGYVPEAMVNYLALLGWAPGDDRELLSRDELVAEFRLDQVNNSPAFFDEKKLAHFNQHYVAAMPVDDFVAAAERWLPPHVDRAALATMAPLVQERVHTLAEVPDMVEFLFVDEPAMDQNSWDKRVVRGAAAAEILDAALAAYESCEWTAEALHEATTTVGERFELGLGKAQFPIRVAVMGRDVGPPLFESLVVLGRQRTLERLQRARERLAAA